MCISKGIEYNLVPNEKLYLILLVWTRHNQHIYYITTKIKQKIGNNIFAAQITQR